MADTEVVKRKRGYAKAAITRVEKAIANMKETTAVEELYIQLELLEKAFMQFKEYDEEIVELDETLSEIDASVVDTSSTSLCCIKCNESHRLHDCSQYNNLDVKKKREFVSTARVCFNCLSKGHTSNRCFSRRRCFICRRKHHASLHAEEPEATNALDDKKESPLETDQPSESTTNTAVITSYSLLPTALVQVKDAYGKSHYCRVLLDSGSEASLITEACVNKLQLKRRNCRIPITGVASNATTNGQTMLIISSRLDENILLEVDGFILDHLTSKLPRLTTDIKNTWTDLNSVQLADPLEFQCRDIDILLGASHFLKVLRQGQLSGPNGLIAQNTAFGWIISGGESKSKPHLALQLEFNVDQTLRKFWELEEIPCQKITTPDHEYCEKHFASTHTRDSSGRFVVRLPFAKDCKRLGNSIQQATLRFKSLETRLQRQVNLRNAYQLFMEEYKQLNHMSEVNPELLQLNNEHFYLPHHPIIKPNNTTTKVRVVFDGSAVTSSSISLNSKLLVGPTVQPDLFSILLRFRLHTVAFTADIERMYRQVRVDDRDCDYQRIVWRDTPTDQLRHYRLLTVTYGTAAAPFLATRALKQLGFDSHAEFQHASNAILNDFYVDDLLSGSNDVSSATMLANDIITVLHYAGFPLHKFASNSQDLLSSLTIVNQRKSMINLDGAGQHKILGLHWDTTTDTFNFQVNMLASPETPTKRSLLSEASRLYDPLGWLAPAIVPIKSLFQQLWLLHVGWDDPLPRSTMETWSKIRSDMKQLENIRIPRLINIMQQVRELHGFADASSTAYGAALYCRSIDEFSNVRVQLVAAKTRVAPIKTISIPRLELCGALLLATLITGVTESMKLKDVAVYCWTDSEVVLHWLSHHPSKWKVFISNRTTQILDLIPTSKWNHVPSADNPADCASRGCTSTELLHHSLWWEGPQWLKHDKNMWPKRVGYDVDVSNVEILERRPARFFHNTVDQDLVSLITSRTSSFSKATRILVYMQRFVSSCRTKLLNPSKESTQRGPITTDEYKWAERHLCKLVQRQHFSVEIRLIQSNQPLTKGTLMSLSPYLDGDGLLRVGGRLKHAECSYEQKHPIILPNDHVLSKMILCYLHQVYLHPSPSLLSHLVRQSFWIVTVRKLARKVTNECLTCRRLSSRPLQQIMGNLPPERVTPTRPFTNTGLDMSGLIEVATKIGRGARYGKAYIVVFMCMSTKAIHLELTGNLTTDAFIAALKRFVSRRGLPITIFCVIINNTKKI